MKFARSVFTLILLGSICSANAFSQAAGKQYELYSWKSKSSWHYSLIEGPNRVTSYEQVTANQLLARGTDEIERMLRKLQRGDRVAWMSGLPAGAKLPPDVLQTDFKHPSRSRIKHVLGYCKKRDIRMTLQ